MVFRVSDMYQRGIRQRLLSGKVLILLSSTYLFYREMDCSTRSAGKIIEMPPKLIEIE